MSKIKSNQIQPLPMSSDPNSLVTQVQQTVISDNNNNRHNKDKFQKYKRRLEKQKQSQFGLDEIHSTSVIQPLPLDEEQPTTPISATGPPVPLLNKESPSPHSTDSQNVIQPDSANKHRSLDNNFSLFKYFMCCFSPPTPPSTQKKTNLPVQPKVLASAVQDANATKLSPVKTPVAAAGTAQSPKGRYLLKPLAPEDYKKKCLVLDLDETLVHSSFKPVPNPDFVIPVEIENQVHNVRPHVDEFLQRLGPLFEIVLFTASLAKYADPVTDSLDTKKVIKHRLFREACFNHRGSYVKDLSQLGRDLKSVIIVDNSPASYLFHPSNAVPITSWFNDVHDTELLDLLPFLEDLTRVDNVMTVLDGTIQADDDSDEEK